MSRAVVLVLGLGLGLALALASALGLASCHRRAPAPAETRTVTDGLGRAVRLPRAVRRVISLAPSTTEILFAIGAGDEVVGLDRYSDWPPEARGLARVGSDLEPSLERIVALRPDVVLTATTANPQAAVEGLERLGIPVYVSKSARLEDLFGDVERVGEIVGRAERAHALAGQLKARLAQLKARAQALRPVPAVVVVWPEPLVVAGRGSHVSELVEAAGGRDVVDDSPLPFPAYSVERLLRRAPEVVIVGSHADGPPPLAPLERLAALPAVRDHRVHVVDGDLLFRPGPRVIEGAEALFALFHPEAGNDGGAP